MLKLAIVKSPDREIVGSYVTNKLKVTIGSSCRNNIVIADPQVISSHLLLTVMKDGLLVENINRVPYYFSNGKKISGQKLHLVGDRFSFGETTIKVEQLTYKPAFDARAELQSRVAELSRRHPLVATLLQLLRDEILNPTIHTTPDVPTKKTGEKKMVKPVPKPPAQPASANEGRTMIARLADIFKDG
jgi:hypothetical protein